jgi:hypothetical protein
MLKSPRDTNAGQPDSTRGKVDRHLKDIDDTISEEDINNIGTDRTPESRINIINGVIEIQDDDDDLYEGSEDKNESEKNVPTPWNIVS